MTSLPPAGGRPHFERNARVTVVIGGVVSQEYAITVRGNATPAIEVDCGAGYKLLIPYEAAGVEVHLDAGPDTAAADAAEGKRVAAQALRDAIAWQESGGPTTGCADCGGLSGRCRAHALDSPTIAAYRELLGGLS